MNVLKFVGNVCYVDTIDKCELPFNFTTLVVDGDIINTFDRLEKHGYQKFDHKNGILFTDGNGNYVYFPDSTKRNFAYATKGVNGLSGWATKIVIGNDTARFPVSV